MSDDSPQNISVILNEISDGDANFSDLVPHVYRQLREIAAFHMSRERRDHTLQATALVNEAFLKIFGNEKLNWSNRNHFYSAAAEAMRRILIDHARKKSSQKRGSNKNPVALEVLDLADEDNLAQLLDVDEALQILEKQDPRAAQVVKLRFFTGLNFAEIAEALEVTERTVFREWTYARTRLHEILTD